MVELENLLGEKEIPVVKKTEGNASSFKINENHVIGLRLRGSKRKQDLTSKI